MRGHPAAPCIAGAGLEELRGLRNQVPARVGI